MVLYRSAKLRRHQYTRVTEWSGGLYISPGDSVIFFRILPAPRCQAAPLPLYSLPKQTLLVHTHLRAGMVHASCSLPQPDHMTQLKVHELCIRKGHSHYNGLLAAGCGLSLLSVHLTWPGFAGSRSGALIATAWASMLHMGNEGFLRITAQIMQARPCLIAFASGDRDPGVVAMPCCDLDWAGACMRRAMAAYADHQVIEQTGEGRSIPASWVQA